MPAFEKHGCNRWPRLTLIALLLALLFGAGSGDRPAAAQPPPDDEAWIVIASQRTEPNKPEAFQTCLRDRLGAGVGRADALRQCYLADAGQDEEQNPLTGIIESATLSNELENAIAALLGAELAAIAVGLTEDQLNSVGGALVGCLSLWGPVAGVSDDGQLDRQILDGCAEDIPEYRNLRAGTASATSPTTAAAPVIQSLGCPGEVTADVAFTCAATLTGTATLFDWQVAGGASVNGSAPTFTTRIAAAGPATINLLACNGDPDADDPNRNCSRLSQIVTVKPVAAPTVDSVTCTPGSGPPPLTVNCTATVQGTTTAATLGWSAPGGEPASGSGDTFSATFRDGGPKPITFTACNGSACAPVQTSTVTVTTAPPPTITALNCSPRTLFTEEAVTCAPSVQGTVTSSAWSAPNGSPASGPGPTFSTRYTTTGAQTITLEACNEGACARLSETVDVSRRQETVRAPLIQNLGCDPRTAAPRQTITCTPALQDITSTTVYTWTASGGSPASGRGQNFTTSFADAGSKTITLEACNGTQCGRQSAAIEVRAATPTTCRQWDITGTWQTSAGNGYTPSFTFQQSGTSIGGTATLNSSEQARAGYTSPNGTIRGTLVGDQLDVTVTWSGRNGPVTGRYTATIVQGRFTNGSAAGQSFNGTGPTRCVSTS